MPYDSLFHDPPLTPPRPGREQRDHERYLLDTHAQRRAPETPRRPLLARALALVGLRS